jgi:hypothetical protein
MSEIERCVGRERKQRKPRKYKTVSIPYGEKKESSRESPCISTIRK